MKKKQLLHVIGTSFAVIGIVFVILRFRLHWNSMDLSRISLETWLIIVLLGTLYGVVSGGLFTFAWWNILRWFSVHTPRWLAYRIYALSQLAKYVPGNIFHLAGRQLMGMSIGLPGKKLLTSITWELALAAGSGCLYSALIFPILYQKCSILLSVMIMMILLSTVLFCLFLLFGCYIVYAFLSLFSLQAVTGIIFLVLVSMIAHKFSASASVLIIGSYIVAWLIGLVTPGAPAGAGVRELILLFLLKGLVQEESLLLCIVLSRVITVLGDILFFIFGLFVPRSVQFDVSYSKLD